MQVKRLQQFTRKVTGSVIKVTKVNTDGTFIVGNVINGTYDKTTARTVTTATMKRHYLPL